MTKEYTCEDCRFYRFENGSHRCVEPGEEMDPMYGISPCYQLLNEGTRSSYLVNGGGEPMKPIQIMTGDHGRMYVLYDNGEVWYRDFSPGEWFKFDLPTEDELNENR